MQMQTLRLGVACVQAALSSWSAVSSQGGRSIAQLISEVRERAQGGGEWLGLVLLGHNL